MSLHYYTKYQNKGLFFFFFFKYIAQTHFSVENVTKWRYAYADVQNKDTKKSWIFWLSKFVEHVHVNLRGTDIKLSTHTK